MHTIDLLRADHDHHRAGLTQLQVQVDALKNCFQEESNKAEALLTLYSNLAGAATVLKWLCGGIVAILGFIGMWAVALPVIQGWFR